MQMCAARLAVGPILIKKSLYIHIYMNACWCACYDKDMYVHIYTFICWKLRTNRGRSDSKKNHLENESCTHVHMYKYVCVCLSSSICICIWILHMSIVDKESQSFRFRKKQIKFPNDSVRFICHWTTRAHQLTRVDTRTHKHAYTHTQSAHMHMRTYEHQ